MIADANLNFEDSLGGSKVVCSGAMATVRLGASSTFGLRPNETLYVV